MDNRGDVSPVASGTEVAGMGVWPSRVFLRAPGKWEKCLGKGHLRQESWNHGAGITDEFWNFDPLRLLGRPGTAGGEEKLRVYME